MHVHFSSHFQTHKYLRWVNSSELMRDLMRQGDYCRLSTPPLLARDRKDVMEDEYFLRKFAAYCRDRENTRQDGKARMEVSIMGTYLGMMPAMDIDSNGLVYLIQLLLLPVYNCYNTIYSEEFSNLFLMITVTYLIMNKTCDREMLCCLLVIHQQTEEFLNYHPIWSHSLAEMTSYHETCPSFFCVLETHFLCAIKPPHPPASHLLSFLPPSHRDSFLRFYCSPRKHFSNTFQTLSKPHASFKPLSLPL